jgi:hypothetical protein
LTLFFPFLLSGIIVVQESKKVDMVEIKIEKILDILDMLDMIDVFFR